jgi:hypothetical protein
MIKNNCTKYFFIDIEIVHKICKVLNIAFIKLSKPREIKKHDERENKNITHVF